MKTSDGNRPTGWFVWLINALAVVAGAGMCLLTLMICVDVFSRYFRLFAMPWSLEVAEYALYGITFLGAPWVLLSNAHISIDILVERLSTRARHKANLLAYGLGALICLILLVASSGAWWRSFTSGTMIQQTFIFPEWWLYVLPPPIFLIMLIIFLGWLRNPPHAAADAASDGI